MLPNKEEHGQSSYRRYGVHGYDLHSWMDEPAQTHGPSHRRFRHDADHPPKWAVDKYGFETAQNIMLDHIFMDRQHSRRYSRSQPLRSAPKTPLTPYEIAEVKVVIALMMVIVGICFMAVNYLDVEIGPVKVILSFIVPILATGLLGEAYLRMLKKSEAVATSPENDDHEEDYDELLEDEVLIHFDDYDEVKG